MRDLFSQCMYVRMYVLVTLRNVNLRLRPGRISQRTYLAESNAEASAEHSLSLVTLTKKLKKKRGQSTIEAKNKKEFNSRKHVLEILHSQVFRLTLIGYLVHYTMSGWRRRMGRTARLGLLNVRIWQSQMQKRVLNTVDG